MRLKQELARLSFGYTCKSKTEYLIYIFQGFIYIICMYNRCVTLGLAQSESCFLWGARQTGKSTLLREQFRSPFYYDMLLSDQYKKFLTNPALLREELSAAGVTGENQKHPVIIDEVQKIPSLLDEVHWLMENRKIRFILCGSSARKLKRGHSNLLGGRAVRYELFPLTFSEIPEFSLQKGLTSGLLPRMYDSPHSKRLLQSYIADYLKEEIAAEALTRNIPAFSRFLDVAAICNGEIINYNNIASDCSVSAPTVKEYFQILQDTLLAIHVPAYTRRVKRRIVTSPKFYYFDVGVAGFLARWGEILPRSSLFGKAFEHFILMELKAHSSYSESFYPIEYWRTSSGVEVDFILNHGEIVLEVKSTGQVNYRHLKGLRTFKEEHKPRRAIVVSQDDKPRTTDDGIEIIPWRLFLEELNAGNLIY